MLSPQNRLLGVIPKDVYERLLARMRTVDLDQRQVLQRPGEAIERVFFPTDCIISVTVTMDDGAMTEAGIVGNREMVGINAFMGGRESTRTEYLTLVPGQAVYVPAEAMLDEFNRSKSLRDLMLKYTQAYIAQLSQNVACNRQHNIKQRLARLLLECRDRVPSGKLRMTQEFIAQLLGVRRAGISEAAAALVGRGAIWRGQKEMRITDEAALRSASCECYRAITDEYDRLLGAPLPRVP